MKVIVGVCNGKKKVRYYLLISVFCFRLNR